MGGIFRPCAGVVQWLLQGGMRWSDTEPQRDTRRRFQGRHLLVLALALAALAHTGCDQMSGLLGAKPVEARTAQDGIDVFLTYQDALIGSSSEKVVEVFGKPKGIFERQSGKVWMYSRWCVEFNSQDEVVRMERDVAASGSGGTRTQSMALAAKPGVPAASPSGAGIVKVSQGGQAVDLRSLLPAGKVAIVDFYADWCGPCRSIAPHLETLARENPKVVLVKIDIVKWGTPVTQQYDINSVPNIRVFDPNGKPVGQPTSNFSKVQSYVKKAGG
jgi:thiol-disulfide isomerase/thioredoxin